MKKERMIRVNDEIQKEIARIIRGELKDPRISVLTSVTHVDTTADLKFCKVYISSMGTGPFGDETAQKEAFEGVQSASGFIRKLIAERLNLRVTPQLIFLRDDSIERGIRISKLIDEVNQ